jgi:hypothetical protein
MPPHLAFHAGKSEEEIRSSSAPEDPLVRLDADEKISRPGSEAEFSLNAKDGDEALQLVGTLRSVHFSEEYNKKLRRKIVSGRNLLIVSQVRSLPDR